MSAKCSSGRCGGVCGGNRGIAGCVHLCLYTAAALTSGWVTGDAVRCLVPAVITASKGSQKESTHIPVCFPVMPDTGSCWDFG